MNQTLVSNIKLPDDTILEDRNANYRERAKDLIIGTADRAEVEFVIDNLSEAVTAAHTDFCCNGTDQHYFKINTGAQIFEMAFDLASLRHLFGLFGDTWQQTEIFQQLKTNHPELIPIITNKRLSWMDKIQAVYNPKYRTEIVEHECSEANATIKKLNWQKMMIKIFSFINIGRLEDEENIPNKTTIYSESRNIHSKGNKSYLLVRSLRNGELEDVSNKERQYYDKQLIIKLVEEVHNGQICLTPESIIIVNKPLRQNGARDRKIPRIILWGKEYIKPRQASITRLGGTKYVTRGAK